MIRRGTQSRRPAVHPARRARYASADSLGNAFNFDMQDADWRADDYRHVINNGLADMINNGSTTSWLLGCHDMPRVATRYGLPLEKDRTGLAGRPGVAADRWSNATAGSGAR